MGPKRRIRLTLINDINRSPDVASKRTKVDVRLESAMHTPIGRRRFGCDLVIQCVVMLTTKMPELRAADIR